MKLLKKVSAVLLALAIIAVMIPQMGNKEVKAAEPTAIWTAENLVKQHSDLKTADKKTATASDTAETQKAAVDALKFNENGLSVELLPQPISSGTAHAWKAATMDINKKTFTYLTGTDNPRTSQSGSLTAATAAPETGTALKINVTNKGIVQAVVQSGGTTGLSGTAMNLKNIYLTSFESGKSTDGKVVWKTLVNSTPKNNITCEFNAEPGKDYYIFIQGSKGSFESITYTQTEDSKVCATVDCLKIKGAAIREETAGLSNGIRFGSIFDATNVRKAGSSALEDIDTLNDVETGTLVALESTMTEKGVTELTLADGNPVAGLKVQRTTYLENKDKQLSYSVAIVNIPEERQAIKFVVRPYLISNGEVYYGDQISASWDEIKAKMAAQ